MYRQGVDGVPGAGVPQGPGGQGGAGRGHRAHPHTGRRPRRRVPGLRREELAQLAGVSVDHYVRLEQGRTLHFSEEVPDAVARALRLDAVEREHLCRPARPTPAYRCIKATASATPTATACPSHWSVTGGDFRVPHFFALHGIQVLLTLVVVLGALSADRAWLHSEQVQARLVGSAALGYCGLVAVVSWQAGRGQSLIHPDTETLAAFAAVLLITTTAIVRVVVTAKRTGTGTGTGTKDAKPLPSAYR